MRSPMPLLSSTALRSRSTSCEQAPRVIPFTQNVQGFGRKWIFPSTVPLARAGCGKTGSACASRVLGSSTNVGELPSARETALNLCTTCASPRLGEVIKCDVGTRELSLRDRSEHYAPQEYLVSKHKPNPTDGHRNHDGSRSDLYPFGTCGPVRWPGHVASQALPRSVTYVAGITRVTG